MVEGGGWKRPRQGKVANGGGRREEGEGDQGGGWREDCEGYIVNFVNHVSPVILQEDYVVDGGGRRWRQPRSREGG